MRSVEKEILDANRTRVEWAGQYLEDLLLRFDDLFYSLHIDRNFINTLEKRSDELSFIELQKTLISAYYTHSRIIDRLAFYIHATGEEILADAVHSGHISYPDIRTGKWTPILNGPVSLRLENVSGSVFAVHSINSFEGRQLLGGLAVRINEDIIDFVMEILDSDAAGDVLLFNESGNLIAGTASSDLINKTINLINSPDSKGYETETIRDDESLILLKRINDSKLSIIKTIPLNQIAASSKRVMTAGIVTGIIIISAVFLLSVIFSQRIARPIIKLAKTMEQTSLLDFEHLDISGHDEISLLERGYNSLMSRMKDLVEKEYQREIDLRNARLNALHAQINPHFLYNTLHLIGGMALEKDSSEIYQISKAVGDLFRYNTGTEGELVPLNSELNHIRNYLMIQEMRFKGRCIIRMDIEESIYDCLIPQFTLQPIVENAFEHGLQPKPGKWNLKISGKNQRRGGILVIEDDGIGMTADRLRQQRRLLAENYYIKSEDKNHIGLKNVDSRLKLHFGQTYRLLLFSSKGIGTRIILKLPHAVKEENNGL